MIGSAQGSWAPTRRPRGQKIWVLAKGYAPDEGGMQTYAQAVAEAYADRGASVTVVTQTSAGPRRTRIKQAEVIDLGRDQSPMILWKFCRALGRLASSEGAPDFLHATTWRTAVPAMLLGYPYAVTFHGREFMYSRGLSRRVMRHVARKALRCIAVSSHTADMLKRRLGDNAPAIEIAWNGTTPGLSFQAANRGENDPPVILSLCRLEPRKNIERAVHAAARSHEAGFAFRFVLCGRGPSHGAIASLLGDLSPSTGIEMAGFVDQGHAEQLYASSDIFLHPQITMDAGRDFEGFGIAIADAMYCGQAVIVGKDGGPAELIEHGITGLIVDGTDTDALAAALQLLLGDAPLRQRLGRQAAAWARRHCRWDRHVEIVLGHEPVV